MQFEAESALLGPFLAALYILFDLVETAHALIRIPIQNFRRASGHPVRFRRWVFLKRLNAWVLDVGYPLEIEILLDSKKCGPQNDYAFVPALPFFLRRCGRAQVLSQLRFRRGREAAKETVYKFAAKA